MIERPYVMCLMMTSLDGKILTENWGNSPAVRKLTAKFEEVHEQIGVKAWIVGRSTMEKDFTGFAKPVLKKGRKNISRQDHVAGSDGDTFAIAIDGNARIGWKKSELQGDHVITILTESVPDAYLAHLQDIGVSYLFAGEKKVYLKTALKKLHDLFGIEKLIVEGGGHINGSFLNEDLIDEIHQVLLPLADGLANTATFFDIDAKDKKSGATLFRLDQIRQMGEDAVWLTYKRRS